MDPFAKLPIVQTPVPLTYVPTLGVALTKVYPAGKRSVTTALGSVLKPKLVAVIVKVTFVPIIGVVLLTVFVTLKSEQDEIVTGTAADCTDAPQDKAEIT